MIIPNIYAQQVNKAVIDLSLSENPLGCSPLVVKALKNITIKDISSYPSKEELLQKISEKFKIKTQNILLGNGSDQLIKLIAQTFINLKNLVIIQKGTFAVFTKECLIAGGKVKFQTPEGLLKLNLKPRVIFLCTPNNPTGEVINIKLIETIIKRNPQSIVVIDEANGEFIDDSFIAKSINKPNCLVLRTFSKAFGLAGVRIGFAIGPLGLINKLGFNQQAFPVSSIACKLAIAALSDQAFINKTKKFIRKERNFLTCELKKRNFLVSDSVTNILFVEFPLAKKLVKLLNNLGVSVVAGSFFSGMDKQGFRIAIKNRQTNRLFLQKLDQALSLLNKQKLVRS